MRNRVYTFCYMVAWLFFKVTHPARVTGREHLMSGATLICANHSSLSDPVYLVYAASLRYQVFPMAKAELLEIPVLGWILKHAGVFGVRRGKSDVGAIKQAMKYLKNGQKVLMFPEGTRVKDDSEAEAKTGAAMLALRTGAPVLPVFIAPKKTWFRPINIVIGEAYYPKTEGPKPTAEDYRRIADEMRERIYGLEGQIK
ncbi:MAG: 1-acyl-sn-glycerol-3-phosphate acyltransferase [Oscillospiraceae bacterium]|nr:1-acyl-sn-glycerol-3-phosphate acyltransferase [Oscillospiraceae bacterium]